MAFREDYQARGASSTKAPSHGGSPRDYTHNRFGHRQAIHTLSNGTGFPAVCFPGGFSTPTSTAPIGVPVGAELLGREFSEPLLLSLAYAYEQAAKTRKLPLATPPLSR